MGPKTGKLCVEMVAFQGFPCLNGNKLVYQPTNKGFSIGTKLPLHILLWLYGGFHSHGGTPLSLDGLLHGKSHLEIDDWEYPYDLGNHQLDIAPRRMGYPLVI